MPGLQRLGPRYDKVLTRITSLAEETPICDFGWKAPSFALARRRRQDLQPRRLCEAERHAGDVHLQPLPLREGGDRPHRARCEGAQGVRHQRRRHLLQRRGALPGGLLRQHEALRRRRIALAFPISTTRARMSRAPMTQPARPTSSASTTELELQYRGRLDASRKEAGPADVAPGAVRGDAGRCRDREGTARADTVHRLLHQVEGRLAPAPMSSSGLTSRSSNHRSCGVLDARLRGHDTRLTSA